MGWWFWLSFYHRRIIQRHEKSLRHDYLRVKTPRLGGREQKSVSVHAWDGGWSSRWSQVHSTAFPHWWVQNIVSSSELHNLIHLLQWPRGPRDCAMCCVDGKHKSFSVQFLTPKVIPPILAIFLLPLASTTTFAGELGKTTWLRFYFRNLSGSRNQQDKIRCESER